MSGCLRNCTRAERDPVLRIDHDFPSFFLKKKRKEKKSSSTEWVPEKRAIDSWGRMRFTMNGKSVNAEDYIVLL